MQIRKTVKMVQELFPENETAPLPLKDAEIYFYPGFFTADTADKFLTLLQQNVDWQQDSIKIFGKILPQPRLTALYANNRKSYSYSGITMNPKDLTAELAEIKEKVEKKTNTEFTTCLLNYYRDGNDSMGWHSDDEKELGRNPVIASLSFGASRMFHLKHRKDPKLRFKIELTPGSLLLMKGSTQHFWLHQLPKTAKKTAPRINLTFRKI